MQIYNGQIDLMKKFLSIRIDIEHFMRNVPKHFLFILSCNILLRVEKGEIKYN